MSTYQDVVDSFESTFQDKYVLPEGLVKQWFIDSVGEFSLDIEPLLYDEATNSFNEQLPQWQIITIALMMKSKYCTREVSRVNKLSNIIGKDISLNNTDSTKKRAQEELLITLDKIQDLLFKQKPTAYI